MTTITPATGEHPTGLQLIAKIIKSARMERGWHARTVAERIGVSIAAVYSYESGTATIPEERLRAICGALGLETDELVRMLPRVNGKTASAKHRASTARAQRAPRALAAVTLGQRIDAVRTAVRGLSQKEAERIFTLVSLSMEESE